jgi:hypothetical protein
VRSVFPWADLRPEISAALDGPSAVRLLETIEQLPAGATGALLINPGSPEGEPSGSVLVEGGRVCWAVATGMKERLTDILRHQASPALDRALLEDAYRRCRVHRKPLGEYLVESGLVSRDGLRRALRQHTGEAVAVLSRASDRSTEWREHRSKRYDASFTFSPSELLVGLGALRGYYKAREASERLHFVLDGAATGAAFVRSSDTAVLLPVAAVGADRIGVRELVDIGRWAAGILDVCQCFSPQRTLVSCTGGGGASFVAWQEGDILYVAACEDPSTSACTVVRTRRPSG